MTRQAKPLLLPLSLEEDAVNREGHKRKREVYSPNIVTSNETQDSVDHPDRRYECPNPSHHQYLALLTVQGEYNSEQAGRSSRIGVAPASALETRCNAVSPPARILPITRRSDLAFPLETRSAEEGVAPEAGRKAPGARSTVGRWPRLFVLAGERVMRPSGDASASMALRVRSQMHGKFPRNPHPMERTCAAHGGSRTVPRNQDTQCAAHCRKTGSPVGAYAFQGGSGFWLGAGSC